VIAGASPSRCRSARYLKSDRLAGEPHTRLRLFCSPHRRESSLYPTITQLERAAGLRQRGHGGAADRQSARPSP
jgi:hypothetical protein